MKSYRYVLIAAISLSALSLAGPAAALEIEVFPGESIQAAIDQAATGDTISIHGAVGHEYVENLTLKPFARQFTSIHEDLGSQGARVRVLTADFRGAKSYKRLSID